MKNRLVRYLALLTSVLFLTSQRSAEAPAPPETLRLIFAGDIMVHRAQILAAQEADGEGYDFRNSFDCIKPVLESADLAIGNLELTMPGEEPFLGYPMFRCPEELAVSLRLAGFDLLMTANNHSNDSGAAGVIHTIDALEEAAFYHAGTYRNAEEAEAWHPMIIYKKGFKLAFLNYTYGTNGIRTRPPSVVNRLDSLQIEEDLRVARDLQPDAIIVMLHWGLEYQLVENKKQQQIARQLMRGGADLIVGAHPHVVQPARWQTANGQKEVLVAYSLGNFISGQFKPNTDGGILLEAVLTKTESGARVEEAAFVPIWRHIERPPSGKRTYRVLPIAAFEQENPTDILFTETDRAKMLEYAAQTRKRVGLPEKPIVLTGVSTTSIH